MPSAWQFVTPPALRRQSRIGRPQLARGRRVARNRTHAVVEDVRKTLLERAHRFRRPVHPQCGPAPHRERTHVVDSVDVIRVLVREQDRIDMVDVIRDQLQAKLGWRVDADALSRIRLHQRTAARALVPRIVAPAHLAATTDLGNAETRPRSEKGQPHTTSTRIRLVVPGMSHGTPAVSSTRSPGFSSASHSMAVRA